MDFPRQIKTLREAQLINPLVLAHIGDAVLELFVRTRVLERGRAKVDKAHRESVAMVSAAAQAAAARLALPLLSEEEGEAFRRGRNARVGSVRKHADTGDYHAATGLECLFGHLYITGRMERAAELFCVCFITDAPESTASKEGKNGD
ncbi:MAG: ribonuclease III [Oscillospiraceae bacterium]|jgi:ribonuclease-3 family protein|nr:ribonuclease III [Oscillospiraceae bacterium]